MKSIFIGIFSAISIFLTGLNPFKSTPVVARPTPTPTEIAVESPMPSIKPSISPAKITNPVKTPPPTPTPTPKPNYLDTRTVSLVPTGNGPLTSRSGNIVINLTGTTSANTSDQNYKILNFTWSGSVSGLSPDKTYSLQFCLKNNSCMGYGASEVFKTDSNGSSVFSMPPAGASYGGVGYTINKNNPITYVIVIEPSSNLDLNTATLRGDYDLKVGF